MLIIVYEHPTKKSVTKIYKAQDFGKYGDIRTAMGMRDNGYKMTTRITIPNEYMKILENFKKNS